MENPDTAEEWMTKDTDRPYAMKALVYNPPYQQGDIVYVSKSAYDQHASIKSGYWELLMKTTCRKPEPTNVVP